jgi:acyl dehydratase
MLDRSLIGHRFPPFQVELEKGRLRLFAKAIGETNPIYTDEDAARTAGYRSLPMPPTYPFCLGKDIPDPFDTLHLFGLDFAEILHGEQSFRYRLPACAGDTLYGQKRVSDIYARKNGALEFIVVVTEFKDGEGRVVCEAEQTIVVQRRAGS